jgi:5-methylcytosine-specific restriction endonuclease McrA
LDGHHVLPKERIKRFAVAVGLDPVRLLWDVSNMMPLCRRCHDRHHTGFLRVRRADLPVEAVLFARSLDLEWVLERLYT